jgi:cytochrome d ubiquinol oxidase subunit II
MADVFYFVLGAGLVAYVLTGGADYGGGFWHLLARGPRKDAQRATIEHAIAPIWEANHVWLIFVIVILFTAFPRAFAVMSVAFHVPLVAALVGIVLRGASFVFKAYGLDPAFVRNRWGRVFAWASAFTPIFFGMVLAGMSSGAITTSGTTVTSGFFAGWTSAFAVLTGLFALSLFALLAAVYLSVAAEDESLRADFRHRALAAEAVAGALAFAVFVAAGREAPLLRARLAESALFWPIQIATAASAAAVVILLLRKRAPLARAFVALQVALVVVGWGDAMHRELILGVVPSADAGLRNETARAVLPALAIGLALVVPSLAMLFRVFRPVRDAASRGPRSGKAGDVPSTRQTARDRSLE